MISHYVFVKVLNYYVQDKVKAWAWWTTKNENFGLKSPRDLCRSRAGSDKVIEYVNKHMTIGE